MAPWRRADRRVVGPVRRGWHGGGVGGGGSGRGGQDHACGPGSLYGQGSRPVGGGVLFIDLHGYDPQPVQPGQALDALLRALGEHIPEGAEARACIGRRWPRSQSRC
jgi:hypothetical protein